MQTSAYAITAGALEASYAAIVESCRRQAIGKIAILGATTGKLMDSPEAMRRMRRRLESDGIAVFCLVYGIGHPMMAAYYRGRAEPPNPLPFYTGGEVVTRRTDAALLPRGWQYAVNEFGFPVFCCACPDDACVAANQRVAHVLAQVFDEIWYDDDFRVDGDQGAGTPTASTASCYCDACLADLARRAGRTVSRQEVLRDQALHDAWTAMKTDRLTALWEAVGEAGRAANPLLKMGLMIRWGGEERDGIDVARLLRGFSGDVRVRAGEGHFGVAEYLPPEGQVQAHLSVAHHVGWLPATVAVLSETTYFQGIRREDVLKKIALAVAAGVREISYCPCVSGWIRHQDFLEPHVPEIHQWRAAFGERGKLENPIAILRSPAAGRGSCDPAARVRDRQIFPLFDLAGLPTIVARLPGPRVPPGVRVVAVTGRTAFDVAPESLAGYEIVVDGAALLEESAFRQWLGIGAVSRLAGGRLDFTADSSWTADGLFHSRPGVILIPYVWHEVPRAERDQLLGEIRRVVGPRTGAASLSGDFEVFLACARHGDRRSILLVNLSQEPRTVSLHLPGNPANLTAPDGTPLPSDFTLDPDAIRLVHADTRGGGVSSQ
ncbi:MAG: hypothetical protein BWZ02_00530 [Lentisphaerae bacterium ADurb.BinA184]|nr:MAG: hypothetical protein BWZ02_00530 [Lentisphaerae bacterium ADurb.BinA184]